MDCGGKRSPTPLSNQANGFGKLCEGALTALLTQAVILNKMKIFSITLASLLATSLFAADGTSTNLAPDQVEAKYTKAIEGRTADILKALALDDQAKAAKVHDTIIAQYRTLKAWHDDNDAKLKAAKHDPNALAKIHASLKTLHDQFLSSLAVNLTPDQVEKVKDKMTYGKVQFTYTGYVNQYPGLSQENRDKILELLKQAREEAMDGGSAEEKTAVFQRYKGKINNYLSKQGIHPQKSKPAADSAADAPAK
jgi:hypothetical protein